MTQSSAPAAPVRFSDEEVERYARQLVLSEIGGPGQQALKRARVLIVGMGGVGNPAALYLAAAGVGTLGLIDDDTVALSNLQRQIAFTTADADRAKVEAGAERLNALNPHVAVRTFNQRVTPDSAAALMQDFDLALDGTDDFETRLAVNAACVAAGKPLVSGGPLVGAGVGVRGTTLLPVSGARDSARRRDLRPRRRGGRPGGRHRGDGGAGGDQADHRRGRTADRPPDAL